MIRFTEHAQDRLNEHRISEEEVFDILREPERVFLDLKTGRFIVVGRWRDKYLVVVFESHEEPVVVTVFPTSKINKVLKRVERGRWIELWKRNTI